MNTNATIAGLPELVSASPEASTVRTNLQQRLNGLADEGFVDCKAMCSPDRNSSSADKLWVLNNVLRQYEQGQCQIEIVEAKS